MEKNTEVNKAANIGVNNIKEEIKMMEMVNSEGLSIREVWDEMANEGKKIKEEIEMMDRVNSEGLSIGEVWDEMANEGKKLREEREMKNINNDVVNNIEEEIKMVNMVKVLGLDIVGVDTAVEKYNSGKYTGAITVDFMGDSLFVEFREMVMGVYYVNPGVVELLSTDDDMVVIETSVVEIKERVAAHILAARESGLGYEEYATEIVNKDLWIYGRGYELLELFSKHLDSYTKERSYMVDINEVKAITLADPQFINESELWEPIGDERYTLPLIYVIENLIMSYIENDELDEEVEHHTDEIIKALVNKGEFLYVIRDGELHEVEGVTSTGIDIEAVELWVPYLIELERAADELWGFTRVVDNLDIRDDFKGEMMMEIWGDELYSFVYQYCREVWWDGGSN